MANSNIKGVIFPNQKVTAPDHGVLFRHCLSDGILNGCEITFTGRNVTIASGYLILAGREIHLTGSITYSIPGSENYPYVRLKMVIDTSKIASVTAFDQIDIVHELASTNSFPSLVQEDINNGGYIYEAELVRLKMSNGAFTSITKRMQPSAPSSGIKAVSVNIPTSAWSSNVATVNVDGMTSYTSKCHPIVSPSPASWAKWVACGIRATNQGTGTLRFACDQTPDAQVTANILMLFT